MTDFNFTSISNMENNDAYKTSVRDKAKKLMGGEKSITADKAFSIFKEYNKNLSPEMADKIQKIAAMDGDTNVSLSEMSAIYALFDMELDSDGEYHFDNKIGSNDAKFGIEASDKDVLQVVNAFKTEEEKSAAKAQEQKLKLTEFADKIKHNLYLGDYANMNEIIDEGVFFEGSFEQLKSKLAEKGIEFTEDSNDKSLSYELDNKKYIVRNIIPIMRNYLNCGDAIVRNGTKEKLDQMRFDTYYDIETDYITEVYDASGKLVQTATQINGDTENSEDATMFFVGGFLTKSHYIASYYNITKYDKKGRPVLGLAYNLRSGKVDAAAVRKYNNDNSYLQYFHPGIDQENKGDTYYSYHSPDGTMSSELYGRELEYFKYYDAKNAE